MIASTPFRFLLVGGGGYIANLAVFAVLHAAGAPYVAASLVSYFITNALMYLGNRYFTFGLDHTGFWSAYVRYVLVGGVVAGLNTLALAFLVESAGLRATPGLAMSLLVITPIAFLLNKRWTFQIAAAA